MGSRRNKRTKYGTLDSTKSDRTAYKVFFYCQASGREPVRDWLRGFSPADRKSVGEDLYTLQLGWPRGMPLARKLEQNLWEFRSRISDGIVRVFFTVENNALVLLHGFEKKTNKTPVGELALAKKRLANINSRKNNESA